MCLLPTYSHRPIHLPNSPDILVLDLRAWLLLHLSLLAMAVSTVQDSVSL